MLFILASSKNPRSAAKGDEPEIFKTLKPVMRRPGSMPKTTFSKVVVPNLYPSRFSNRVTLPSKRRETVPVGPFLCLPTMSSDSSGV